MIAPVIRLFDRFLMDSVCGGVVDCEVSMLSETRRLRASICGVPAGDRGYRRIGKRSGPGGEKLIPPDVQMARQTLPRGGAWTLRDNLHASSGGISD